MGHSPQPAKFRPRHALDNFRHALAYIDALPQLTLLGAIVGLATGLLVVVFRLCIDLPLTVFVPGNAENFEALSPIVRTLLIAGGALTLYLLIRFSRRHRDMGVGHALDRLHNYQGYLPWRNTLLQFVCGAIGMISGQSIGREGPAVHLGAGAGSLVGQKLKLPNNSLQTLVACGVAAAIAASFNTPMAGVIFAMEVILMEYTIVGFVPVIMASVIGAALCQAVFGHQGMIAVDNATMGSLLELPYVAVGGLLIAACAAAFIRLNLLALKTVRWPLFVRLSLATTLTCALAWEIPEIMGQGYDTLNGAMAGEFLITSLAIIAVAKLASSALVTGLGIPGGIIGPTLVTGACIGGVLGLMAQYIYPAASPGFYVTLGMAAMMAAVLNAPLAALVAALELSYNPNIIFPAMLMIVIASVATRSFCRLEGIFAEQLKHSGRPLEFRPGQQALRKVGVISILDTRYAIAPRQLNYDEARALLAKRPTWLVVETDNKKLLLQASDLANYLEEAPLELLSLEEDLDLLAFPARRRLLVPIHPTATLLEALQALRSAGTDALYVTRPSTPLISSVRGIVTQEAIDNHYQP